jgi:hypothetical protein
VACFLSPEWFGELRAGELQSGAAAGSPVEGHQLDLVVGIAVPGAPDVLGGEVRYQVVVNGPGAAVLTGPDAGRTAHVLLNADYATVAGIASGRISVLDAISSGRARITGNTAALPAHQSALEALDLVPPLVRASTSF